MRLGKREYPIGDLQVGESIVISAAQDLAWLKRKQSPAKRIIAAIKKHEVSWNKRFSWEVIRGGVKVHRLA